MTVISKRRAANTFLMPHAEAAVAAEVAESAARLFRASCRKPHEYRKVLNRNCCYRTPFCCLPAQLAARSGNVYSPQTNFIVT